MAQGSIIWRCWICGNKSQGTCKHPRAKYSIAYRLNGRQKWQSVGRNKKDAERRLAEVMNGINNGTYFRPTRVLFSDFSDQWLVASASRIKPSTLRTYRWIVNKHLKPGFGDKPVSQISTESIQRFITEKLQAGLTPKTVRHLLILLKLMLKHARRWKYIRENPAEEVEAPRLEHAEMDFLNPDEIRRLLKHSDEPYRTMFLTAVLTGMRRGELLGLQWGDIDWQKGSIYVRRTVFWRTSLEMGQDKTRWTFLTPKSKLSRRTVTMSPILKEALELHHLTSPTSPDDLVFSTGKGEPMDPDNLVHREFHPALTRAGIRRIRFHDLRHTYAALLIAQGAHAKFIQSQLGHASIQTTLDRYGHLLPEIQNGVGERLDREVFGLSDSVKLGDVGSELKQLVRAIG